MTQRETRESINSDEFLRSILFFYIAHSSKLYTTRYFPNILSVSLARYKIQLTRKQLPCLMLRSYCRLRLPFIPLENCFDLPSIFHRFTTINVRSQLQFFPNSRPIARGKARDSKLRLAALILVIPCAIDEILDHRKRTRRRRGSREHYRRASTPLEFYDTRVNHARTT